MKNSDGFFGITKQIFLQGIFFDLVGLYQRIIYTYKVI